MASGAPRADFKLVLDAVKPDQAPAVVVELMEILQVDEKTATDATRNVPIVLVGGMSPQQAACLKSHIVRLARVGAQLRLTSEPVGKVKQLRWQTPPAATRRPACIFVCPSCGERFIVQRWQAPARPPAQAAARNARPAAAPAPQAAAPAEPVEAEPIEAEALEAEPIEAEAIEAEPIQAEPIEAEPAEEPPPAGQGDEDQQAPENEPAPEPEADDVPSDAPAAEPPAEAAEPAPPAEAEPVPLEPEAEQAEPVAMFGAFDPAPEEPPQLRPAPPKPPPQAAPPQPPPAPQPQMAQPVAVPPQPTPPPPPPPQAQPLQGKPLPTPAPVQPKPQPAPARPKPVPAARPVAAPPAKGVAVAAQGEAAAGPRYDVSVATVKLRAKKQERLAELIAARQGTTFEEAMKLCERTMVVVCKEGTSDEAKDWSKALEDIGVKPRVRKRG